MYPAKQRQPLSEIRGAIRCDHSSWAFDLRNQPKRAIFTIFGADRADGEQWSHQMAQQLFLTQVRISSA